MLLDIIYSNSNNRSERPQREPKKFLICNNKKNIVDPMHNAKFSNTKIFENQVYMKRRKMEHNFTYFSCLAD
jgi:hypothetical protein